MSSHSELEELFKNKNQAKSYANARPTYPASLFERLASLTEQHELAWDVGTGNGQAASKIAEHFKTVVATDVSESQLTHAIEVPNVKYAHMSATPSATELEQIVGRPGSVDLITVATAVHWFDLDAFYPVVKKMLRKPGGVFAAWTYAQHYVTAEVDKVTDGWHERLLRFRPPQVTHVFNGYKSLPFPFEPLEKNRGRGVEPETMEMTTEMDFDGYIHLWESSSATRVAREHGEDVLSEDGKKTMLAAWGQRDQVRIVRFPFFLLVGTCSEA